MKPAGGTEILYNELCSRLGHEWDPAVNLIVSACNDNSIVHGKKNVLWQHLNYDQPNVQLMSSKEFVDNVDCFVYVSHWQYEKFRYFFNIPEYKSTVIKNCIRPIPYKVKPASGKIKLIYTSTPWRGLDVLLDAIQLIDRDDIQLDIYSSTKIYGSAYEQNTLRYTSLFNRAKAAKNIRYMGYASNAGIRNALQAAHIYAYPSTFEETSCLAAIEAGAAGCRMVVSNLGALPETCAEWASFVTHDANKARMASAYAYALEDAINLYKYNDPYYEHQSAYFNTFWSWDCRINNWRTLLNKFKQHVVT